LQPSQSKEEEELRRLSVEMRYLEQTAETLQQRVSMVNAALTDLTYANMTMEGIEKEILKERMQELEKTRNSVQQQFTQIAERIALGRTRMDSLVATLRQGNAPGNV
jgi:prefoldin subunit 5